MSFAHSKLAEEGFVDEQKLLKAYQAYTKDGRLTGEERFYEVAVLELTARGMREIVRLVAQDLDLCSR